MKNWIAASAAVTGTLIAATYPLQAQEEGGLQATLDFSQRFEATSNPGLDIPDEGDATFATTSLTFNLLARTSTQRLSFSAGGVFREGDIPSGSDISTGFADPRVNFRYSREGFNADFDVSASFRQTDVSFQSLDAFVNEDGEIEIPEDFDDLTGSGLRNTFRLSTRLDTGKDAPLGFTFTAGVDATRYENVTSPSLTDTTRTRFGITSRLRFSPVTTGRVSFNFDRFEDDNAVNTERDTYNLTFGLTNQLANATTLDVAIGFEEIETRETTGNETDSGVVGRVGVERQMPNGTASASIETSLDQTGDRVTARAGRSFDLPLGSIAASIGLTSFEGESPDVIGTLNWQRQMPTNTLSARVNRSVTTNSDDEERIATSASLNFTQQINSVSSFGIGANYGLTETSSATSQNTTQAGVSVSYNRALTRNWGYNVGVSHRFRDESNNGTADSTSLFFGLNGSFDLLNRR